jgi:hypothetical protein
MRRGLLLLLAIVAGALGCVIDPLDLKDKACDEAHPCAADYTCIDGICELDGDDDSGAAQ